MNTFRLAKNCIRRAAFLILSLFLMTCTSACSREQKPDEDSIQVYYVNPSETGIMSTTYTLKADNDDIMDAIAELLELLKTMPDRLQYEAPISGDIELIGYSLNDRLLTLNFNSKYYNLDRTLEILDRAAIVRTFTQIEGVEYVSFQIEGTPLTDKAGNIIGNMSSDTFVYNVGNEINTYEKVELHLYFATEDGQKLKPVYRSVVYNSNISMERLAVEQVISGPNADIAYPTISKDSKVRSTNVKDGVCYVDFDNAFVNQPNKVSVEVAIYSIVNTLTELPNINKVVLSVNGDSSFSYMDHIINGPYERNLDIIE
jgi:germination protein M